MSESKNLQRLPTRIADVGASPFTAPFPSAPCAKSVPGAFDHAGPAEPPPPGMQVGPHPHIGLQTFTWMIRGEVLHRDSLGSEQIIRPGQVNLMTAGRGIAHSEESQTTHVHAAQLWIALPDSHRHIPPRFQHYPDLPGAQIGDYQATVLAGESLGLTAPAEVHSPLGRGSACLLQYRSCTRQLSLRTDFEHAVMSLSGHVTVGPAPARAGAVLPARRHRIRGAGVRAGQPLAHHWRGTHGRGHPAVVELRGPHHGGHATGTRTVGGGSCHRRAHDRRCPTSFWPARGIAPQAFACTFAGRHAARIQISAQPNEDLRFRTKIVRKETTHQTQDGVLRIFRKI